MGAMDMELSQTEDPSSSPLPFARSYQIEALEKAIKQNTIVFLETGSGKTLIAIMLLRFYAHLLKKPSSPYIAIFLVPTVVLVTQQAESISMHTDLKVGKYWGEMGVDFWDAATWKEQQNKHEVLVMTPAILLDALRRSFIELDKIEALIFDECHNARGKHPYACIMKEFYHRQLPNSKLPRIFGMTASPIKAKGCSTSTYWKQISELENVLNSKVHTCKSESVLAEFIPFSTVKLKLYEEINFPCALYKRLEDELRKLTIKHKSSLKKLTLAESAEDSALKKLEKMSNTFLFCFTELGLWLALKAAEFLSSVEIGIVIWGDMDTKVETIVHGFALDVFKLLSSYVPSGLEWSNCDNMKADVEAGFLTAKTLCLVESLLEYRKFVDLRCIIFVERVITAVVVRALLSMVLLKLCGWNTEYIAGCNAALQTQSRRKHNEIVEEFRKGKVNIIVATSILEEGLDVQSCNLVIRFDPSHTVCSFIQSRGRARMPNSDFLIMVNSGDDSELSRVKNYVSSGDMMRKESLSHASLPCGPAEFDQYDDMFYRVESTGALVTLSSSVSLIYFYCSRLPSDGYFKPYPRFIIDEESELCTIQFPNSCPIQSIVVQGSRKKLKQIACLEACKKLHKIGALTDHLVPDIVAEHILAQEIEEVPYCDEQACYFAPELVSFSQRNYSVEYYCYIIEMEKNFVYDISVHDTVLLVINELNFDVGNIDFDLEVDRGNIAVHMRYLGRISLTLDQILHCRRFQVAVLSILLDHNIEKLIKVVDKLQKDEDFTHVDYLLLPGCGHGSPENSSFIDWNCISSGLFQSSNVMDSHTDCIHSGDSCLVYTNNGFVCGCMLKNCLVYTPHNGYMYCITGFLNDLNGNSHLRLKDGEVVTYKDYYKNQYGLDLQFEEQALLCGRHIIGVQNCLQRCRQQKDKEPSASSVELPPELCFVLMSPISVNTFYTFSFVPSIMHRVESLLLSANLRKMLADQCMQEVDIPVMKVLEAITTRKCQESFHLESMEILGDSFLKYAVSQQLFVNYQNNHEGLLSLKRQKIISNAALCKLGCKKKIPGFIRNEPFDPKEWVIPGDPCGNSVLAEEQLSASRKIYIRGSKKIKRKRVADVVEALIGAFLSSGGEAAALVLMNWLGIEVDFFNTPYQREFPTCSTMHINIKHLEALLRYSFRDATLLVEALAHGSYVLPGIPRCYQRLEFLGDAVLDHLITLHLYSEYPALSPGLLTDLRSASVNNDCYAQSALRAGLHKHILHCSQELHKHLVATLYNLDQLSSEATYGWGFETNFPKVLADIIESLAGAIFVDSGYDKETVFKSIRPLLEPLVTPETLKVHPVKELHDLCQRQHFDIRKPVESYVGGQASITLEVEANGIVHSHTSTASDKSTAKRLACKGILMSLKGSILEI
ncbi:hypothetical protein Nepgr_009448 [Nepenthes gracilis]|uniref:Uncharacterized protein n=1 Tax=Nepenthes gracilis TaxID=150966 RepID=A0AAD3SAK2_NEPGR|nr:hypothetical protein Nepgr_009448 [Nepenthes gracilis]